MRDRGVHRDVLSLLNHRDKQIRRDHTRLKSSLQSPTVPIYDPDFPTDAVDGQICLQDGEPWYYWDGAWHPFGRPGYGITATIYTAFEPLSVGASHQIDFDDAFAWTESKSGSGIWGQAWGFETNDSWTDEDGVHHNTIHSYDRTENAFEGDTHSLTVPFVGDTYALGTSGFTGLDSETPMMLLKPGFYLCNSELTFKMRTSDGIVIVIPYDANSLWVNFGIQGRVTGAGTPWNLSQANGTGHSNYSVVNVQIPTGSGLNNLQEEVPSGPNPAHPLGDIIHSTQHIFELTKAEDNTFASVGIGYSVANSLASNEDNFGNPYDLLGGSFIFTLTHLPIEPVRGDITAYADYVAP